MNIISISSWIASLFLVLSEGPGHSEDLVANQRVSPVNEHTSPFVQSMLSENSDLRSDFFTWRDGGMELLKTNGLFLIVGSGLPAQGKCISTNECATVENALSKYSTPFVAEHYQVRLVQANMIIQTPWVIKDHADDRKKVMQTQIQAGDVLIIPRVE